MESLSVYKRAIKDLLRIGKKLYIFFFIKSLAEQSQPFIGFIYMTRIIHTLTIEAFGEIPGLIIQFVLISLCLQLISGIVEPFYQNENALIYRKLYAEPFKKMLTMHFHYAESSEIREKLDVVNRKNMNSQSSPPMIYIRTIYAIPSLISIVWGVILLYPLFQVDRSLLPESFWWLNPLIVLGIFVLIIGISVCIQLRQSKKSSKEFGGVLNSIQKAMAKFIYESDLLSDIKSGKEVRIYHLTERMIENLYKSTDISNELLANSYKKFRKLSIPTTFLFQVITYMIYAYLGLLVLVGALNVALIVQLSSALSQMIKAIPDAIQQIMMMFSAPEDLVEYYEFMDLPDEEKIGSIPIEKRLDNEYEFTIEDVSFAYPGSEDIVLKNLTENFEVGKKYAIVGENGSGKTTFIKLLTRLYEPMEGSLKMNKVDSSKYDLREYFNLFGVVFQDYHLLGFSIGQNISVNPEFDKERAMETLDKVGLGDFIRGLDRQLDTPLGTEFDDSGVNVSGGQGQKIAIARSLYKDAPIMILDEPTAALDPVTEFEIYQNFDNLVEDKTAFYISHRLSSSKFCDEILVFDKGEIIQRGTHDDLVEEEGKYQELWTAQAQYYQ